MLKWPKRGQKVGLDAQGRQRPLQVVIMVAIYKCYVILSLQYHSDSAKSARSRTNASTHVSSRGSYVAARSAALLPTDFSDVRPCWNRRTLRRESGMDAMPSPRLRYCVTNKFLRVESACVVPYPFVVTRRAGPCASFSGFARHSPEWRSVRLRDPEDVATRLVSAFYSSRAERDTHHVSPVAHQATRRHWREGVLVRLADIRIIYIFLGGVGTFSLRT